MSDCATLVRPTDVGEAVHVGLRYANPTYRSPFDTEAVKLFNYLFWSMW